MRTRAIATASLFVALSGAVAACTPQSITGAWCQYPADCARPNECSYHRCRPRCAAASDCPSGVCLAGHCGVEQDQGCATMVGRECASPLVCAADRCSLPTAPAGDAGPADAGAPDAGADGG